MTRSEVLPGSHIGSYTITSKLGETPWAETFVAAGAGDTLVALKVIDAGAEAGWPDIERTKEKLAAVQPHLVLPIVEAARDETVGAKYVATPLSDHPSLADLVDIYALAPAEAIALVKNLAIALDEAHAAGLVHLALKPSNVFVGPPPTYAVRLGDFGADALRRAKKERGALAWLAPEQIHGEGAADAKADVFTLALLAFFAVTAKSYWAASSDDGDALLAEMEGPRKTPSERARALGVELPAALDGPLLRALGPADRRPASARELADALEATLAEKPEPSERSLDRSSQRHIKATQKATQKLEKYQPPPIQKQTVKMAPFQPPNVPAPIEAAPPADTRTTPKQKLLAVPRWMMFAVALVIVVIAGLSFRAVNTPPAPPAPPAPSAAPSTSAALAPPSGEASSAEPLVVPPPPPPSAEPPLRPDQAEIDVVCVPGCDRVFINNKLVSTNPVRMAPATYGIGAQKSGYAPQYRNVKCRGGERTTVKFVLAPKK